jgi:shikimate kinase
MDVTRIYLVGYMGCGKSYWGKRLADSLSFDFVDLDNLIEEREGLTIPVIFKQFGETSFRKSEQKALLSTKELKRPTIISTGGGAPCFHDNMSLMNTIGQTLFLEASPFVLKQNILKSDDERPIVKAVPEGELETYIANHLNSRLPFYQQAQFTCKVDGLTLENLKQLFQ